MRSVFRGAVPLLAAAALGLTHPAPAPCAPPPPAAPRITVAVEPEDEAPDLPRVVAPHRLVLEPLKDPSSAGAPPSAIVPAAATATPAAIDLLAPPAAPFTGTRGTVQGKVLVAPSGLPAPPTGVTSAASKTLKIGPVHPSSVVQSSPATERGPETRAWPAAFVTSQEAPAADNQASVKRQTPRVEKMADAAMPASEAAPIYVNTLKQRVADACGAAAVSVGVEPKRNGSVFVKVRLRNAAADQAMAEKIMLIPEMTAPNVHLLMEVER